MEPKNDPTFVMGGSRKRRMVIIPWENIEYFDGVLGEFGSYVCPMAMTTSFKKDGAKWALFDFEADILIYQNILDLYEMVTGESVLLFTDICS